MLNIQFKQTAIVRVQGQDVIASNGQEFQLPDDDATFYLSHGFAELIVAQEAPLKEAHESSPKARDRARGKPKSHGAKRVPARGRKR